MPLGDQKESLRRDLGSGALELLEVLQLLALHKLIDTFEVLGDLSTPELLDLAH